MKTIAFPDGVKVPTLGQGTWKMGNDSSLRKSESDALRYGMDLGMNLIDTAEMYADAELVVRDALAGRRDEAFVVSKVLPGNASLRGTVQACENSLRRLNIECIDLYLLHWVGKYPIAETLEAFTILKDKGKIAAFGVSNFDVSDMQKAWESDGGMQIATNQVLYNLHRRGVEWSLKPWCEQHNIPLMAYSPVNQGDIDSSPFSAIAAKHSVNQFQIAISWLLHQSNVIVIPKAVKKHHIDQNYASAEIQLDSADLELLDQYFPPPDGKHPLEVI